MSKILILFTFLLTACASIDDPSTKVYMPSFEEEKQLKDVLDLILLGTNLNLTLYHGNSNEEFDLQRIEDLRDALIGASYECKASNCLTLNIYYSLEGYLRAKVEPVRVYYVDGKVSGLSTDYGECQRVDKEVDVYIFNTDFPKLGVGHGIRFGIEGTGIFVYSISNETLHYGALLQHE